MIRILGIMTGTSCDGLDAADVLFTHKGWDTAKNLSAPYPPALRQRILAVQRPGNRLTIKELLELDRDLGNWYGKTIRKLIARLSSPPDVIANHGQTVAHFPSGEVTLQLGTPARLAKETGLTVVSHFREGDMAAGGEGAPLVPLFHKMLAWTLSQGQGGIAIHNIGGISNLTYVSPHGELLAFDTGPGNIWIDAATEKATRGRMKFDKDGKLGFAGEVNAKAFNKLLRHPYFSKSPPKSTGRDEFPPSLFLSNCRSRGPELVTTAALITVETIARAYEKWIFRSGLPLHAVYLCGGGARNHFLCEGLRTRLPEVEFLNLDFEGLDSQYIEAQAFAMYGLYSLLGKPLGGPWTGARGFGPPGQITPGENWPKILRKLQAFTQIRW